MDNLSSATPGPPLKTAANVLRIFRTVHPRENVLWQTVPVVTNCPLDKSINSGFKLSWKFQLTNHDVKHYVKTYFFGKTSNMLT